MDSLFNPSHGIPKISLKILPIHIYGFSTHSYNKEMVKIHSSLCPPTIFNGTIDHLFLTLSE